MSTRLPIRIVTVSRDYGSGGAEVARLIGRALGWRVIDRALIEEVARRIQAPEAEIAAMDEHVGGIVERIGGLFARGIPESPVSGGLPDPDAIAGVVRAVLRDALDSLPFVVVGHGSQCYYSRREDALRVRIVAPFRDRVRRVAARRGLTLEAAERETESRDTERRRYIRHHYGCDVGDARLYAMHLDTSVLTLEEAARLVVQIVTWRETPGAQPALAGVVPLP
jgi:cytidylate kinase